MSISEPQILTEIAIVSQTSVISESVEELVREHARMVFRIAFSLLRNHADAEDVAQEVFLRAFRNGSRLLQVTNQKAWIARISWREALRRSKQRDQPKDETETSLAKLETGRLSVDDALAEQQKRDLLRALIATLPRDLREPLVLSTIEEMSSSDIAEVLAIPEASVRTRIARARNMLKQKLESLLRSRSR